MSGDKLECLRLRAFYAKFIAEIDRQQFGNIRKQIKIVWHFFPGKHRNRILQIASFFQLCLHKYSVQKSLNKKYWTMWAATTTRKKTATLPTLYFSFGSFLLPRSERLLMFEMVIFWHSDCNPMRSATCNSARVTRTGSNDIEKSTGHFHPTIYSLNGERVRTNKKKTLKLNAIIYYLLASAVRMG